MDTIFSKNCTFFCPGECSSTGGKSQDDLWNRKLELLAIYREINGHFNVPQRYKTLKGLGPWLSKQKTYLTHRKLSKGRKELLKVIGFNQNLLFSAFGYDWIDKFWELKQFNEKYGHCNVPQTTRKNKKLAIWLKNQKQAFRKGIMDQNKKILFREYGMEWGKEAESKKIPWFERFLELVEYFKNTGNSKVPQRAGSLGRWVQKQRTLFKKGLLKREKISLLDNINFVWIFPPNKFTHHYHKKNKIFKE